MIIKEAEVRKIQDGFSRLLDDDWVIIYHHS